LSTATQREMNALVHMEHRHQHVPWRSRIAAESCDHVRQLSDASPCVGSRARQAVDQSLRAARSDARPQYYKVCGVAHCRPAYTSRVLNYPQIELKYFDVRGRAQFLRDFLLCREIPFEDDRVSLAAGFEAWQALRPDRTITGPFQKLPVLRWGDRLIAETTVIASFLHHSSGDAGRLSESGNLRHEMLISSVHVDLMMAIALLLWSDLAYPGADLGTSSKRVLERIQTHLAVLDRTLIEWQWLESAAARPVMIADCILWDQINCAQHVFGSKLSLDATPTLARFYQECPGRETFERLLDAKPCQVTGRPGEADCVARIRELVASG